MPAALAASAKAMPCRTSPTTPSLCQGVCTAYTPYAPSNSRDGQCVCEVRLPGPSQSIPFSSREGGRNLDDLLTCPDEGLGHGPAVLPSGLDPDPPHRPKPSGPR